MKKLFFILILFITSSISFGQISTGQAPKSFALDLPDSGIPTLIYNINVAQAMYEDGISSDTALVIGRTITTNIDFLNEAGKTFESQNFSIFQLRITSDSAQSIAVYFNRFYLPIGAELYAYNQSRDFMVGAFTSYNNTSNDTFAIQPINGESIIIELYLPNTVPLDSIDLEIDEVANNYVSLIPTDDCFSNVECGNYNNIQRSVMRWIFRDTKKDATYICSCALLNQDVSPNSVKPYVYTANHCGNDADLSTAVFLFNYQSPTCSGNNGPKSYTSIGAIQKAKKSIFDMFLMELNQIPPPDYNVFYAGWDRSSQSGFVNGIHHPHGFIKKISEGSITATAGGYYRVRWDRNNSPTEGGSSGSPLLDFVNDRVVGNLSSGSSRCNNINGYDFYGQFQSQWNDVQGSSKELESWLDPNGNSPSYNDGRDPCYNDLIIQNRLFYPAGNYQSSNSVTIQAGNTITASNVTIPSNSEYHFTAGTRIYLKSGFQVKNGSYFTASITPCSQIARKNGIDIRESLKNTTIQHDLDPVAVKEYLSIYPNPFNHKTMIEFSVQQKDNISILFYDIYGTKIYTLTENFTYENGIYQINFDSNLAQLSAGVYFCTIITSTYSQTKKIIITR